MIRSPAVTDRLTDELSAAGVTATVIGVDEPLYEQVVSLAALAYKRPRTELAAAEDSYSEIYALLRGSRLVGTISVTRACQGHMEAQEHFPKTMLSKFQEVTCAAYRLAVDPSECPPLRFARLLMRLSFSDGLALGMRLAVATARPEMVGYYHRVGYLPLRVEPFAHPRLITPHILVACPADASRTSLFRDLCTSLIDPVSIAEIKPYLAPTQNRPFIHHD